MLHNPSNLFSGGNVTVDSMPYLRMAQQRQARQQAIDEASARHFSELPEKLNMAGVREQDLTDPAGNGGINADLDGIRNFWDQNKAGIIRGGKQQQDYQKLINLVSQKIAQSKDAAKNQMLVGKAVLSPNGWKPREDDVPVIHNMDKSIYDPTGKKEDGVSAYGMNDLSLAAAPYTSQKQQQFDKVVIGEAKTQRDQNTQPTLDAQGQKVLNTFRYTPNDIYNAALKAGQLAGSDKTMKYRYDDLLHDPDAVKTASEALSKLSGAPVVASTPEQMAAGLKAHELSNVAEIKEEKDVAAANAFKLRLQNQREAATLRNLRIKEAGKNKRLALLTKSNLPDIYGKLDGQPVVEQTSKTFNDAPTIGQPFNGSTENKVKLKEVTNFTLPEMDDLFGKLNNRNERPNPPIEKDGKMYVKVADDGSFLDANDVPLDPDATAARTYGRLHGVKEAISKGKIAIGSGATTAPKKIKGTNTKLY